MLQANNFRNPSKFPRTVSACPRLFSCLRTLSKILNTNFLYQRPLIVSDFILLYVRLSFVAKELNMTNLYLLSIFVFNQKVFSSFHWCIICVSKFCVSILLLRQLTQDKNVHRIFVLRAEIMIRIVRWWSLKWLNYIRMKEGGIKFLTRI